MTVTSTVSPSLQRGLRFLGVWPNVPYSTIYLLIYMSSILFIQYFQYSYIFAHLKFNELPNLVDGLSVTLDYTLTMFKLTILWIHRRVFHQMLIVMDNDWHECSNINQYLYLMVIKASISHLCSNAMLNFYVIVGIFYLLGDYAIHFMYAMDEYNDTLRQFPIKIQFPFETGQSPVFELLAVSLFVHVVLNTYTVAVLNALIFTLVFHTSGQIDIICQEFRIVSEKVSLHGHSISALEMLIERHNKIILFSDHINKIFSSMALMQVFWNTIVICCLGILVMTSVHDDETNIIALAKSIFAYIGIMVEIFIFCFAGEYLSFKSKSISNAVYESLWYDMPLNQNKIIPFIMMRSQKQLTITAGKIMHLSLEAFAKIMKASASYISVLYAMYR